MDLKKTIILVVIVAAASAGLTRFYFPKVEYQNTETTKEVVKNDIKTIIKTVVRPDGSKEITEETTDKSTKKETSKTEVIVASKSQWMFDVGARMNTDKDIYYDLQVQRRILGPFYMGAKISTDKTLGLSIGMEF